MNPSSSKCDTTDAGTLPNGTTDDEGFSDDYPKGPSSQFVYTKLPRSNNLIRGQNGVYAVGKQLASGRYGAVYEVLRKIDGRRFAAKLEVCDLGTNALSNVIFTCV